MRYESRLFAWLEGFVNFFLLNVLWLITSSLIITIFPATAAMFGVIRKWVKHKDVPLFKTFYQMFKENFGQSIGIGFIWSGISFLLILDYQLLLPLDSLIEGILLLVLILVSLLYIFVSIYIFPIMVHFQASWRSIIKNSLVLPIMLPFQTIFLTLLIALVTYFLYSFMFLFLLFGSALSYVVYSTIHRGLERIVGR
jgi:uncharacterized membrane protein YesL